MLSWVIVLLSFSGIVEGPAFHRPDVHPWRTDSSEGNLGDGSPPSSISV